MCLKLLCSIMLCNMCTLVCICSSWEGSQLIYSHIASTEIALSGKETLSGSLNTTQTANVISDHHPPCCSSSGITAAVYTAWTQQCSSRPGSRAEFSLTRIREQDKALKSCRNPYSILWLQPIRQKCQGRLSLVPSLHGIGTHYQWYQVIMASTINDARAMDAGRCDLCPQPQLLLPHPWPGLATCTRGPKVHPSSQPLWLHSCSSSYCGSCRVIRRNHKISAEQSQARAKTWHCK